MQSRCSLRTFHAEVFRSFQKPGETDEINVSPGLSNIHAICCECFTTNTVVTSECSGFRNRHLQCDFNPFFISEVSDEVSFVVFQELQKELALFVDCDKVSASW